MASGSRDLHRPIPPLPDLKEYQHLTEKERMNAGYPYKPSDPELCAGRDNAKKLCQEYNTTKWDDRKRRREILRELFNPACADNQIAIIPTFRCDYGYNITIGNNVEFNYDCCILDCAPIEIGNNVLFAPSVHLYAATHPIDPKYRMSGENYCELAYPIKIGDNVWIGGHSVVNPGVTIGDNVVVGAGSVVTKDVPSNVVVAGNPARIIRILDLSEPPEYYKQCSKPQGEGSRNVE